MTRKERLWGKQAEDLAGQGGIQVTQNVQVPERGGSLVLLLSLSQVT